MTDNAPQCGLTVRAIAGTYNVLLTWTLDAPPPADFLGFSIERTDGHGNRRWLPNRIRLAADPVQSSAVEEMPSSARAPLQRFRWGDYTTQPNSTYTYRIVPRFGSPEKVVADGIAAERAPDDLAGGIAVTVTTEDVTDRRTAVFFNRGAAASQAYVRRFGDTDPDFNPAALVWLSRGLEEAIIDFLGRAKNGKWALHASIYEFQKPSLLAALEAAHRRGVEVRVVYHARNTGAKDHARAKNEAAIAKAGIVFAEPRLEGPKSAIMHDKFVVLLDGEKGGPKKPVAVWTGSTNWTDGGIWGQLNVGHAVWDAKVAEVYERAFRWLTDDRSGDAWETEVATLTPPPKTVDAIPDGITPILSPQPSLDMLELYADVCRSAQVVLVSAPFRLHKTIRDALATHDPDALRYMMSDKVGGFGDDGEIEIFNRVPGQIGTVATNLKTPLNNFQNRKLMEAENFHHNGIHLHSKVILADPFGPDPILITGSANFSDPSTRENDENSLIFRGDAAVAAIYATEFMRMFEHYLFRQTVEDHRKKTGDATIPPLVPDGSWATDYFTSGTPKYLDRVAFFAGGPTRAERSVRAAARRPAPKAKAAKPKP